MVRDATGRYRKSPQAEADILAAAEDILRARLQRLGTLSSPEDAFAFLRVRLAGLRHEEFHVAWLDQRHRVVDVERLFRGTIDTAAVYPREVVVSALQHNAAACLLAHNHPSGTPEPSAADRVITLRLKEALAVIDVRVVDHVVVAAEGVVSLAQRGWV